MKNQRHIKILELINRDDIETQTDIVNALNKEGYNVTQATVSRDIRELKLSKTSIDGKQRYVSLTMEDKNLNEKYLRVLSDGFVSIDMAQNILVIKTVSGMAMAVAAALDTFKFNEIVGTIAGDDTIMCAIRTVDDTIILMDRIKKMIKQN